MLQYAFCIGQIVRTKRRHPGRPSVAAYRVLRLLPAGEDDIPLYRVSSLSSGVEWVAREDGIEPLDPR